VPEDGFHYFPSPDRDDDAERIAHLYLYCAMAVAKWADCKKRLFPDAKRRSDAEQNSIAVFREVRDAIDAAIETNDVRSIAAARLGERLEHACAYLALYADTASLAEYRSMICPETSLEDQGGFESALWERKWNAPDVHSPIEVTRVEVGRLRLERLYEPKDRALRRVFNQEPSIKPIEPLFKAPSAVRASDFLRPVRIPFSRIEVKRMFLQAKVKPKQAAFGVKIVFDGAKQKDDPTAWRGIYRKRENFPADLQNLLRSRMSVKNLSSSDSVTSK
jgi:hypothetical protein